VQSWTDALRPAVLRAGRAKLWWTAIVAVMARRAAVPLIAANDNAKGPARASKNTERLEQADAGWHGGNVAPPQCAGGTNNRDEKSLPSLHRKTPAITNGQLAVIARGSRDVQQGDADGGQS
jgi:hypothetical protein